jgi:hypothetical protein
MTRVVREGTITLAYPFASQDLGLSKFTLAADVQREAPFHKAKALLGTLFLPELSVTAPCENVAGERAQRDDGVGFAAMARYGLA